MSIHRIVITGGPCAGKTTAMSWIQNAFTQKGYTVLFVPETATEFISGGVAPWTCGTNLDYQMCQMELQLTKEKLFERAAKTMKQDKILIVCDRGALDNKAYMTEDEMTLVMRKLKVTEAQIMQHYDAVFHLVSAAKGAEEFYTTENNQARTETVEQAIELDNKLIKAWTGHPHLRIIDNNTDFEKKMRRLLSEISSFLGIPETNGVERKFLIRYPNVEWLAARPNCQRIEIIQTYLRSSPDEEIRVRQRGIGDSFIYFQTTRRMGAPDQKIEIERRLSQEEYLTLLMDADTRRRQIRKTRYCLMEPNRYYEIDVYPDCDDCAVVQVDMGTEDELCFPEEIHVIREIEPYEEADMLVTGGIRE